MLGLVGGMTVVLHPTTPNKITGRSISFEPMDKSYWQTAMLQNQEDKRSKNTIICVICANLRSTLLAVWHFSDTLNL